MDKSKKRLAIIEKARREKIRRIANNEWTLGIDAVAQPLLSALTSAVAEPVSGIVGLAGLPFGADAAAGAIEKTRSALTYKPTDEGAISNIKKAAYGLEPVTDAAANLSKVPGDFVYDVTGSPALATAAYSAVPAIVELAGLKGASKLPGKKYEISSIDENYKGPLHNQLGGVSPLKIFDDEKIYYHATNVGFDQFNKKYGGTYFAEKPDIVEAIFARDSTAGGNVKKVKLAKGNTFDARYSKMTDEQKEILREAISSVIDDDDIMDAAQVGGIALEDADPFEVFTDGEFYLLYGRDKQNDVLNALRSKGYDYVVFDDNLTFGEPNVSTVVFDPENIKIIDD